MQNNNNNNRRTLNDRNYVESPSKRFKPTASCSGTSDVKTTGLKNLAIDEILNSKTNEIFKRGKFLGKGGFAKCYEVWSKSNKDVKKGNNNYGRILAAKIVGQDKLEKKFHKLKMRQEIEIHSSLNHPNIVAFIDSFHDAFNVYILLELCRRRSLMELHKRRITVTEPEARYFTHQITQGLCYLHSNDIVHRDLKLGNILLDDYLHIKIGDFGLAAKMNHGQLRKSMCGTPNYIAPEILNKVGHDFKVDSWSLGCVVYTLLIGRPPFERSSLKETYTSIKEHVYSFPANSTLSIYGKKLIDSLLEMRPDKRPTMKEVLKDEFFSRGFHPQSLPDSCLTTEPRFDLMEMNSEEKVAQPPSSQQSHNCSTYKSKSMEYLTDLFNLLNRAKKANVIEGDCEDMQNPETAPIYWIAKWIDYTDKYGLAIMLSDGSICVKFNDATRLVSPFIGENLQYIDKDGREELYTIRVFPDMLLKKVTLLKYFKRYMDSNLISCQPLRECDVGAGQMSRLPSVKMWFRSRHTTTFYLSNHTFQTNFIETHEKVILCPLLQSITIFFDKDKAVTYKLQNIIENGCCATIINLIKNCVPLVEHFLSMNSRSGSRNSKGVI